MQQAYVWELNVIVLPAGHVVLAICRAHGHLHLWGHHPRLCSALLCESRAPHIWIPHQVTIFRMSITTMIMVSDGKSDALRDPQAGAFASHPKCSMAKSG